MVVGQIGEPVSIFSKTSIRKPRILPEKPFLRSTLIMTAIMKAIEKLREYHFLTRLNSLSVSTSKLFSLQNVQDFFAGQSQ